MNNFKDYWNTLYENPTWVRPKYINWLDNYEHALNRCKTEVLDLGCGIGNGTSYLIKKGLSVIACDYSKVALSKLKAEIKGAKTKLIDISQRLPFNDNTFDLIVADLSLHYFDEKTTCKIMQDIRRILKPKGILLARVNSINDINYGAGQGEKLEENYYYVNGYNKRFFSVNDVNKFFSIIGSVKVKEAEMLRVFETKKMIEIEVTKE